MENIFVMTEDRAIKQDIRSLKIIILNLIPTKIETEKEDIAMVKDLQLLSYSDIAGVHLISDMACRNFYCTGHCEYDSDTLAREYFRDIDKGACD